MLVVADELPLLADKISVMDYLLPVIRYCRSFRMDVLLIAQGTTIASHGCAGNTDTLRESLDFIQLKKDFYTKERYAIWKTEGADPVTMSVQTPALPDYKGHAGHGPRLRDYGGYGLHSAPSDRRKHDFTDVRNHRNHG